jgi:hypothetical protein
MKSRTNLSFDSLTNLPPQPLPFDPNDFPKLGIHLSYLPLFIQSCGGRDILKDFTTTEVCEKFLVPMTSSTKSSYCELLLSLKYPEYVNTATVFISHAWKYKFLDVIDSIIFYFEENSATTTSSASSPSLLSPLSPADDTHDHFIWFDLFSNNQHQALNLSFHHFPHSNSTIWSYGHGFRSMG